MYNIIMKYFIVTILFAMSLFTPKAFADQLNIEAIPDLLPVEYMEEAAFAKQTRLVEAAPYNDEALAYKINLPENWGDNAAFANITNNDGKLVEQVLTTLAKYVGPPDPEHARSYFTIDAMKLTYEVSAENWFINYVLGNGLSLQGMNIENKKNLTAIYIEVRKDTTYIVRTKVIINGSKIVIGRYFVPQGKFNDQKVLQGQVLDSFQLINPDDSPIEEFETYGFLNQSYFDYPPSWN